MARRAVLALFLAVACLSPHPACAASDEAGAHPEQAAAYEVLVPVLLEQMGKGFMENTERNYRDKQIGRCPPAFDKLRTGIQEKALPLLLGTIRHPDTRLRLMTLLSDVYSKEQLESIAQRKPPVTSDAQRAHLDSALATLYDDIVLRFTGSDEFSSVMTNIYLEALPELARCDSPVPDVTDQVRPASSLALRAYARMQPMLRSIFQKAFTEGMDEAIRANGSKASAVDCQAWIAPAREAALAKVLPEYLRLIASEQTRQLLAAQLDAIYSPAQLEEIARGGNPATTPAQSHALNQAFSRLNIDLHERASRDTGFSAAMSAFMATVSTGAEQCLKQEREGTNGNRDRPW